jgi:flagellar basal body rod protein FlgB
MDRETRLLSETGLRFNAAQTMLKGQFRALKSAIQEGRS